MDIFKDIFNFFIDKDYSFASKFVGLLVFLILLFSVDNFLGFSFYYSTNQKISQLKSIEELKNTCGSNIELVKVLEKTEQEIINRQNVFDIFIGLFSRDSFDNEKVNEKICDTVYVIKYDTVFLKDINHNKFLYLDTLSILNYLRLDSNSKISKNVDTINSSIVLLQNSNVESKLSGKESRSQIL